MYICIYIFDKKHKRENRLYNQIRESSTEGKKKTLLACSATVGTHSSKTELNSSCEQTDATDSKSKRTVFFSMVEIRKI